MKNKKYIIIKALAFFLAMSFFVSCKKVEVEKEADKQEINSWIYESMKSYYFWEDKLPDVKTTNLLHDPETYFNGLLYDFGKTDRFSWIEGSAEELKNSLNGLNRVFGWKYQPYQANSTGSRVAFAIQYVLPNSAAERAGIVRGDLITQVNGQDITIENYRSLLSGETVTVTLGKYENGTINSTNVSHQLTKEVTQTNAIQYSTILNIEDKKVGYFVYTQFLTSNDKDLNKLFGEFKNAKINELIIDLRFNPGGYISSAELLSSLIVKNPNPNQLMTRQVWNSEQTAKAKAKNGENIFDTYFFTSNSNVGTLNNPRTLERVYILTSNGTASASELIINNLKPFMEVILVGEHTYGKNVGSITLEDKTEPKRWDWGMQPIVLKTVNALGQSEYGTSNGFLPDITVKDNLLPFRPFGDKNETLLNAALVDIFGPDVLASKNGRKTPSTAFKSLSNFGITGNPNLDRTDMWIDKLPY